MATGHSPGEHRVILFGGQGSPSIFSPNATAAAEQDARSMSAGSILLSKCHAAFLEEIASLDATSQLSLAIDASLFRSPRDLLSPPVQYHTHPVLQATTIFLCQLLRYLGETLSHDESFEDSFDKLQATAGFSSGILTAAVVSRSRSVVDLLRDGVHAFRLAFWIACRSSLRIIKESEVFSGEASEQADSEATLSLVTCGLSQAQVEQELVQFYPHEHPQKDPSQAIQKPRRMEISAISNSGNISVSGPSHDLCAFRGQLLRTTPHLTTTFAFVHGWYHGGSQLEDVVAQVLEDLDRRAIFFPPYSYTAKPIHSTLDGTLFDQSTTSSGELAEWLTRHLLIYCVDWSATTHKIAANMRFSLERGLSSTIKILSYGPGSGSLFPDFHPADPRVELVDVSPFKSGGRPAGLSPGRQNDVAIVGMSVQFPKAKDTEELWETISQGLNAVQEIPESRFQVSDYYAEGSVKPRSMPVKHGVFLDDPFSFDNSFFNISPREAKSMDPQQRILLHAAQEAFEDAGYVPDSSPSFQRATTGCYIGLATGDYTDNLRDDIDTFYSSGTLRAFHSGRISYFFRLSGPSIVTDTACSSSAVSIYQACRSLQNGDCTAAIAGGVNVITSPDMYLGLSRGHFLSQTGGCKPFDAAADGYCRAEGCALFVLKRLSDAVAEGDRIHGVIRGVLTNQSGNSNSITHPHSQTQTELLQRLLRQTDVEPGSVGVVEAHGTGTQAGDTREIETLRAVFGTHRSTADPLIVSSIKGNIGHCEAASGAAGLAKLLLMLRKRKVPLQSGLANINPALGDLGGSGLVIPRQTIPWNHSKRTPRRAVLNNFGAAGSNASLLLEDWVEPPKLRTHRSKHDNAHGRSTYVFGLSAKSERALQSSISSHIELLGQETHQPMLGDICYTATARRQHYNHRISLTCTSVADLLTKLQQCQSMPSHLMKHATPTVFVFTGQGAIYRGMGRELMTSYPPFKDIIMSCDRIIHGLGLACPSVLSFMQDNFQDGIDTLADEGQTIASQCACVVLEYALAKVFISWGIVPDYVMGHSLGEYAALCVSGALTLEDTLRVVAFRAKMMVDNCLGNTSGMLACNLSSEEVDAVLSGSPALAQVSIACLNGPQDTVVGGPLNQLSTFQESCKTRKVKTKLMNVPYAFHTPAMDPIVESLRELGRSVKFQQPAIPVMSNVHGRLFDEGDFSSDYFADHARLPVRFSECATRLQLPTGSPALGRPLFLEIGPHPLLLPTLQSLDLASSCTYLATLRRGRDAWAAISDTLSAIFLRKNAVRWREVFAGTSARVTGLPGHLLEGSKFLVPYREVAQGRDGIGNPGSDASGRVTTGFRLLPWINATASPSEELVLETDMATLGPLILGHDVGGTPICPASVFHELAIEATQAFLDLAETQVALVSRMNFANPLVHVPSSQESSRMTVCVRIAKQSDPSSGAAEFRIFSRSAWKGSPETLHCTGSVSVQDVDSSASHWVRDQAIVARQGRYFSGSGKDHSSTFRTKVLYEAVFTRVVKYSSEYQTLAYLDVAESNLEGMGSFKIPSASVSQAGYLAHPVFTDTLLHAAGFIANLAVGSAGVGICARVESIEIAYRDLDYSDCFKIYCSLLEVKGGILADAIAMTSSGKVAAVVRGMEFKKLQLATFQQALSRLSSPASKSSAREHEQHPTPTQAKPHLQGASETPPPSIDSMSSPGSSQVLKDVVVEVGGFAEQDIDYTKSLGDLGIDSLMQIEIASKLARLFPGRTGLSHHALSQCETLEEMDDMLSSVLQPPADKSPRETPRGVPGHELTTSPAASSAQSAVPGSSDSSACPTPASPTHDRLSLPATLHTSADNRVPLCLFHDGSGQVDMYARLHDHDRTVYAFSDPYFASKLDRYHFHSLSQMAEHYLSAILSNPQHQQVPLILGGWSFGGVVAFEAARQLAARGFEVKGLVLIDSPSPVHHEPLPAEIISTITKPSGRPSQLASGSTVALEQEFLANASLLGAYKPKPLAVRSGRGLNTVMLKSKDVLDTEALWSVRYDWLSRQDTRSAALLAWEELVGGHVEVLPIPGNHFEPFKKDNIEETAARLWEACRLIEQSDADH